jgi:hypothetical protein
MLSSLAIFVRSILLIARFPFVLHLPDRKGMREGMRRHMSDCTGNVHTALRYLQVAKEARFLRTMEACSVSESLGYSA